MHSSHLTLSLAGLLFGLSACSGSATDAAPTSLPSEESAAAAQHEPEVTIDTAELRTSASRPRPAECEESAKCTRDAASLEGSAAEACREAVGKCLRALSERTAPSLGRLGDCRTEARTCLAGDGDRESCTADFRDCVKGTIAADAP